MNGSVGSAWDVVGQAFGQVSDSHREARPPALARRIAALDWDALRRSLDEDGFVATPPLLTAAECEGLVALYGRDARFRSTVVMARHAFGSGEYRYLAYPLPRPVQSLRRQLYAQLAPLANRWAQALGGEPDFPADLEDYLARCHGAGADAAHAAAAALPGRRLQPPTPGPLRRAGLSAASGVLPEPARAGFRGR